MVAVQRERRILSCRLHKPLYRIEAILHAFARLPAERATWVLEVAARGAARLQHSDALPPNWNLGNRVAVSGHARRTTALTRAYRRSAAIRKRTRVTDGTSVSLLEAMAVGCLPVLSDLPADREWVHDGEGGILS